MKYLKKNLIILNIVSFLIIAFAPFSVKATSKVDTIISSMSNEEKISQMLLPSFQYDADSGQNVAITEINSNIENILKNHGFAGIILFAQNTQNIEQTVRLIDSFQVANAYNNKPQLFIAIDQEGGYVTRLQEGTATSGNMALGATNNPNNAYEAASIIGSELYALGINLNFAPVVDINNNPANPIIGIRSFSDDPNMVGEFGFKYIKGLQSQNVMTAVKHFPGHGDTNEDTHTKLAILNKTYDELKQMELIPFEKAISASTDMIMTSHIAFPNIYQSLLPATLSKEMLTDILRDDMGYNGIIVTDSLNMDAIVNNYDKIDASIKAINAGADILLMPYETKTTTQFSEFENYITTLASKVGNEIDETRVNDSVRRILTLKEQKGLLDTYSVDLESKIANAKNIVSSKTNHDKEFEIAKQGVTLVKNNNDILPLKDSTKKTVILYGWSSHANSIDYAIQKLINDQKITSEHNIVKYRITNTISDIKDQIKDADNVIIEYTIESEEELDPNIDDTIKKVDDIIEYAHSNNSKVIYLSAQLPYDLGRFENADALMAVYNPTGLSVNPNNVDNITVKYGPNIIAGIYMIFANGEKIKGKLPVNIPKLTSNYKYSSEILYKRGYGLDYNYDNKNIDVEVKEDNLTTNTNLLLLNNKEETKLEKLSNIVKEKDKIDKQKKSLKQPSKESDKNIILYVVAVFLLIILVFKLKKNNHS